MTGRQHATAVTSLLTGATVWGLIWYPYRMIEQTGLGGVQASMLTYLVALVFGLIVFQATIRSSKFSWWLVGIGLASGGCNLGYVLAVLHGEVMRVLLLFYLSPLWTVLLSRLLLNERLSRDGALVIALSLVGAFVMLWSPRLGLPWPEVRAEWIALAAGFLFALQNVLIRKTPQLPIEVKAIAVFFGVIVLGIVLLPLEPQSSIAGLDNAGWTIVLATGLVLLVVNVVVQFGLTHIAANQASVIYLFELVVAAVSSWLLANEAMGLREWVGGLLIIAASIFSGKLAGKTASA